MYDIVEGIHKALRIESTWLFVLVIALGSALVGGVVAWVIDVGYKNSQEYKESHHKTEITAPQVVWDPPGAITHGTPLSGIQLNAVSPVEGVFTYDPPAGTILPEGRNDLIATFYPREPEKYTKYTEHSSITVTAAATTHPRNLPLPPKVKPAPPNYSQLRISQSDEISTRADAPYRIKVVIQTDLEFRSLKLALECDQPIVDGSGHLTMPASLQGFDMSVSQTKPNFYLFSYMGTATPFSPSNPLIIYINAAKPIRCLNASTF